MVISGEPVAWVLYCGICIVTVTVGLILARHPDRFVAWLGQFLQRYARAHNLTDEQLDRMALPGTRSWYGGALSDFVRNAEGSPEAYPQLMNYVRWFGMLMVAFVVGMNIIGLLLLAAALLSPFVSICFSSQPNCVP